MSCSPRHASSWGLGYSKALQGDSGSHRQANSFRVGQALRSATVLARMGGAPKGGVGCYPGVHAPNTVQWICYPGVHALSGAPNTLQWICVIRGCTLPTQCSGYVIRGCTPYQEPPILCSGYSKHWIPRLAVNRVFVKPAVDEPWPLSVEERAGVGRGKEETGNGGP
jgi:hypothetical protein